MHDVAPEPGPYTWQDFIALDEDDLRELIDGELVEVEVPTRAHERIAALMTWYASMGVPEYWIVDPAARTLERLVLHDGRYTIEDALGGNRVFRPASFEGLEVPLSRLWRAVDDALPR